MRRTWRPETLAVVAGRPEEPGAPLNTPPTFVSVFRDGGTYGYGRWGNPTWTAFEEALGTLEGGRALAFSSGQAAIAAVLETLPVAATVVLPDSAYLGTRGLLADLASARRLKMLAVDVTDTQAVLAAMAGADLLWLETPTNPLLGIVDLKRVLRRRTTST